MDNQETALAVRREAGIIHSMDDAQRAATAMAKSGYFPDSREAAQALVKILAGQEFGFGPFSSMTGVHIIQNKPTLAANLMAAAVKRTKKYNYRVVELTEKSCRIAWFENNEKVGESSFSIQEAERAGLTGKDNWRKFPSDMLFARAISRGQKRYAPDVFNGATVYTPDEMGADVDEDGNVIPGAFSETSGENNEQKKEPKPTPQPTSERPYSPEALKERIGVMVDSFAGKTCTDGQRTSVKINLSSMTGSEDNYHTLLAWLVGEPHVSKLSNEQVLALAKWIHVTKDADDQWIPDALSILEAKSAFEQALKDQGQTSLEIQ